MRIALALVVLFASAARAEEDAPSRAKASYGAGVKHYNLGEYREALGKFREAYLAVPDAVFLFNMGQCYRQLGEHEASARQYRAYLRERPEAPNRAEVEKFIAIAEAEIQRKAANVPPTGVERVETPQPTTDAPAKTTAAPAQPAPAAPAPEAPPPKKSKWWIGVVVAAAAVVVGGAVGIGVAYAIPKDATEPMGNAAGGTVEFR